MKALRVRWPAFPQGLISRVRISRRSRHPGYFSGQAGVREDETIDDPNRKTNGQRHPGAVRRGDCRCETGAAPGIAVKNAFPRIFQRDKEKK